MRLDRLRTLYGDELTVLHDWERLNESPESVSCEVVLESLDNATNWFAPWYVGRRARLDGSLMPVNVNEDPLNELAALDVIPAGTRVPRFPAALRHGEIPEGMRTKAIANLQEVLLRQVPITVCVMAYDLEKRGVLERIILDGNHRLAAALRLRDSQMDEFLEPPEMRVVVFMLRENHPVTAETHMMAGEDGWTWNGFTPDIARIRSDADQPFNRGQPRVVA